MERRVDALERRADKIDGALLDISKAMTAMVEFQVDTKNNSKHIDVLFDKADQNTTAIRTIENNIYETCDIKTKEMSTMETSLETKIGETEEKAEKHSNKLFLWSMAVLVVAFGYIVDDDRTEIAKMNTIIESMSSIDKSMAVVIVNQNHLKERLDEHIDREHK